jgi:IS30 family transposase
MNRYQHLTADERHQITAMRRLHYSQADIAKELSRSPSTISRELRRNVTRHDGWYRAEKAHSYATARRSSQRRRSWFSSNQWHQVEALLKRKLSPEQVSFTLKEQGSAASATKRSTGTSLKTRKLAAISIGSCGSCQRSAGSAITARIPGEC